MAYRTILLSFAVTSLSLKTAVAAEQGVFLSLCREDSLPYVALALFIVLISVIFIVIFWNRKLRINYELKAMEFNQELLERKKAEEELTKAKELLEERAMDLDLANASLQGQIEERSLMDLALMESEERLNSILSSIDDVVWSVSADDFKALYINPAVERVYDRTSDEFFDTPNLWMEWIHPEDRPFVQEYIRKQLARPQHFTEAQGIEYRIIRPDGEVRWMYDKITVVRDTAGAPRKINGIARDITDRKKAEEELYKAKDLAENATKLKDKFVSLVAHDLKSPFASMMGLLKILEGGSENPLNRKQKEIMRHVLSTGERLITMIDELLDISRLQTGKIKPEPRFIDGSFAVTSAIGKVTHLAHNKEIVIENKIPLGYRIYADHSLLGEVLQNLLTNAIKFSNRGGHVTISIPPSEKGAICVADNGVGMKKELASIIFRHEEKTSTPGTEGELGTGLGLPLSHDIMKAMGGGLYAESEEGVGSSFYIALPEVRPRVLIAADEDPIRFLLRQYLEPMNVEIFETDNGESGAVRMASLAPHLVIADIMLTADNTSFFEFVKSSPIFGKTPMLLVTADEDHELRDKAAKFGVADFIARPVDATEFLTKIKRFII